ncbi:hypothetical protein pb186bvf_002364 [Paramecium bursaria]
MMSKEFQFNEMDYEISFSQIVSSCPRQNHIRRINLTKQNCKSKYHECMPIFGFCINKNCQAVSKKVCEYCILDELHGKDVGFSLDDLLYEDQVDRIIEMFQSQIRLRLEKAKLNFQLYQTTIFDNLNTVDQRKQDTDSLNNQFSECDELLENLSLTKYIDQVESSNMGLYKYLLQIYQLYNRLEFNLSWIIKKQYKIQSCDQIQENEQNQEQIGNIRKCRLDLLCKILKNTIYLKGQIDNEQNEIIKSQIEIILKMAIDYAYEKNYYVAFEICEIISEQYKYKQLAYLNKGIILDMQKKYEEALQQFDKVLELEPNNYESLYRKGLTFNHLNQYEQALMFYNNSLNQEPHKFAIWNKMANLYIKLNQYQKAIKVLTNLIDKCTKQSQTPDSDKNLLLKYQIKAEKLIRGHQTMQNEIQQEHSNLPPLQYFYSLAKGNFDKAINLNPSFYLAYIKKAQYLKEKDLFLKVQNLSGHNIQLEQIHQQGEYDQSLKLLQQCSEQSKSQIYMGKALYKFQVFVQKNNKNIQNHSGCQKEQINNVRIIFLYYKILVFMILIFAIVLMKMQNFDESNQLLDQVIEQDHNNNVSYKLKGKLLLKLNRSWEALQMFDKAIELGFLKYKIYIYQGDKIYLFLGMSYSQLKQYNQAIVIFNKVFQIDRLNTKCIYQMGITLLHSQKYNEALQQFEKVLSINSNFYQGYLQIGITYLKQLKYDESIQSFDKAIKISPNNSQLWKMKGIALRKYGKYQESIFNFDKALLLDPNDISIQNQRGFYLIQSVKSENKLKNSLLRIENPNDVYNYIHKGQNKQIQQETLLSQFSSMKVQQFNLKKQSNQMKKILYPKVRKSTAYSKFMGRKIHQQFIRAQRLWYNINVIQAMFFVKMNDFEISHLIYNLLWQNYPTDEHLKLCEGNMKN